MCTSLHGAPHISNAWYESLRWDGVAEHHLRYLRVAILVLIARGMSDVDVLSFRRGAHRQNDNNIIAAISWEWPHAAYMRKHS